MVSLYLITLEGLVRSEVIVVQSMGDRVPWMSLGKQRQLLKRSDSPPKEMGLFCSFDPSLMFSPNALLIRRGWETLFPWTPSPATAAPSNTFGNHIWKFRSETLSFLHILFTTCQFICMLNHQCISFNCFTENVTSSNS